MATYDLKKWTDYYSSAKKNAKRVKTAEYDLKSAEAKDEYASEINEESLSFVEDTRENEVERLITEREVAEEMANLGLSGSGADASARAGVNRLYAGKREGLYRERRRIVSLLAREMEKKLADIKNQKDSALQKIDESYTKLAASEAEAEYKASLRSKK